MKLCILVAVLFWLIQGAFGQRERLVTADNPKPAELPTLSVWQQKNQERVLTHVASAFPNVPNFTCDTWCYEVGGVDFLDGKALDAGRLQLRHRWKEQPQTIFVTTVTPEPGAVEFLAKAELDSTVADKLPERLPGLNACWQLRSAPDFASKPDAYPKFVERCFIFTDDGLTLLHKTVRNKHTRWPEDNPFNNPPWVQVYTPVWRPVVKSYAQSFAAFSPTRYIYPIMGCVSRDGKYLTALANDSAASMAQAWHDCMHNIAAWAPDKPGGEPVWRIRIYALENNPDELLHRVGRDFPKALTLKEGRVNPDGSK